MPTLKESREAAGARYAIALNELTAALIELAAIDRALHNASVAEYAPDLRTFTGHLPQIIPSELRHPDFWPGPGQNIHDAVATRADRIIARGI